jgi:hypothetical protein
MRCYSHLSDAEKARAEPLVLRLTDASEWLPFLDTYRTIRVAPEPTFRMILEGIRDLSFAGWTLRPGMAPA